MHKRRNNSKNRRPPLNYRINRNWNFTIITMSQYRLRRSSVFQGYRVRSERLATNDLSPGNTDTRDAFIRLACPAKLDSDDAKICSSSPANHGSRASRRNINSDQSALAIYAPGPRSLGGRFGRARVKKRFHVNRPVRRLLVRNQPPSQKGK